LLGKGKSFQGGGRKIRSTGNKLEQEGETRRPDGRLFLGTHPPPVRDVCVWAKKQGCTGSEKKIRCVKQKGGKGGKDPATGQRTSLEGQKLASKPTLRQGEAALKCGERTISRANLVKTREGRRLVRRSERG